MSVHTGEIYLNQRVLIKADSIVDCVLTQFFLHAVLNLAYNSLNYYSLLEVIVGLNPSVAKKSQPRAAFLTRYKLQ